MHNSIPWNLTVSVDPGTAVSVSDIKSHLRIDDDEEDTLIGDYGASAERAVEAELAIAILAQTLVLRLDRFPAWRIRLPRPPLTSVTSITYIDTDGNSQTWASSNYTVNTFTTPGEIVLAFGKSWPVTRSIPNAVVVTYVAGYADVDALPAMIKSAVLLTAGEIFENRERSATEVIKELALLERLEANHRCYWEGAQY